jgi:hypothetical protein
MKRNKNIKKLSTKATGKLLIDHYNSKLSTNHFNQKYTEELTDYERNQIFGNSDFTGVFRNNRTYLSLLQNSSNNEEGTELETRSLSEQLLIQDVNPNDGNDFSNNRWWKETSKWIMRGNKNLNNNFAPVPCALPPVYSYSTGEITCNHILEKIITDGNPLITMADWSAILCEELGNIYCRPNISEFDCTEFCGSNPHPSNVQSWYDEYFFDWYDQNISWSHIGWRPTTFGGFDSAIRSPMWSYYKNVTNSYNWYENNYGSLVSPFNGKNRLCGPGWGAFPATAVLANQELAPDVWNNHWYAWTSSFASNFIFWCDDVNLCGQCSAGQHCGVNTTDSQCYDNSTGETVFNDSQAGTEFGDSGTNPYGDSPEPCGTGNGSPTVVCPNGEVVCFESQCPGSCLCTSHNGSFECSTDWSPGQSSGGMDGYNDCNPGFEPVCDIDQCVSIGPGDSEAGDTLCAPGNSSTCDNIDDRCHWEPFGPNPGCYFYELPNQWCCGECTCESTGTLAYTGQNQYEEGMGNPDDPNFGDTELGDRVNPNVEEDHGKHDEYYEGFHDE